MSPDIPTCCLQSTRCGPPVETGSLASKPVYPSLLISHLVVYTCYLFTSINLDSDIIFFCTLLISIWHHLIHILFSPNWLRSGKQAEGDTEWSRLRAGACWVRFLSAHLLGARREERRGRGEGGLNPSLRAFRSTVPGYSELLGVWNELLAGAD